MRRLLLFLFIFVIILIIFTISTKNSNNQITNFITGLPIANGGACPDLNSDNLVDISDLTLLAQTDNKCSGQAGYNANADFGNDGCVNYVAGNPDKTCFDFYYGKNVQCPVSYYSNEICDNKDNDCDGLIDEGNVCPVCNTGQRIGDVNGDNLINDLDSQIVLNINVGLASAPSNICCADVSEDGYISSFDSSLILQIASGTSQSPGTCPIQAVCTTPQCNPTNNQQYCSNGQWANCPSGQICSNGRCITPVTCTDECVLNTRICSGNGYQICGNYDSDLCTEYSSVTLCTQNQVCSNGICSGSQVTQNTCSDGTNYNQCSTSQPRYCNNGVLVNNCAVCGCPNNGECLSDGSCRVVTQGTQSTDPNLLNNPPRLLFIHSISLTEYQTNTNNLINFNNYANDPELQQISFTFPNNELTFNSDVIDCYLTGPILNCDQPKKDGNVVVTIVASDGIKASQADFEINVIKSFVPAIPEEEMLPEQLENIAPIADAGADKTILSGSIVILDGSKSYDINNNLPRFQDSYIWLENDKEIGRGINLKTTLAAGLHRITLKVTDSYGLSSTDEILIDVKPKTTCANTKTLYAPSDTICNNKWPSTEGELIKINSIEYSCNLVEVCDESLDYIIEDSINCCDGTPLTDSRRANSCSFANKYAENNVKRCQALYVIKSLGGDAVYMQDYLEAEMCCRGVTELCNDYVNLYAAKPIPNTETKNILKDNLRCLNTPENNPPGKWFSDTKIDKNNIALQDVPAHVSLNVLSTGTCVDYSFSITTLLRKAGYLQNEVYTVEAPNHAYNLVKLPLDRKYSIVDTTGNNEPPLIFGKTPLYYEYCENIRKCYNDNGEVICPSLKNIYGCENVKESLVREGARETKVAGYRVAKIIKTITDLFKEEIER